MHRAVDILERLRDDLQVADTVWLVKATPTTLEMITVGGRFTHGTHRTFARAGTLTDRVLARGEDVVIIRDVWSLDLPADTRRTLLASRAQSNVIAIVHVDGEPWGVVSVTSSRNECPFTDEHAALVRQAADDVGTRLSVADRVGS
jgi:GAF domain-containing protein